MTEKWMPGERPFWLSVAARPQQQEQLNCMCTDQMLEAKHGSLHSTFTNPFNFHNNPMKWMLFLGSFYKWGMKSDITCPKPHCWDITRTPSSEDLSVFCSVGDISGFGCFCVPPFLDSQISTEIPVVLPLLHFIETQRSLNVSPHLVGEAKYHMVHVKSL